MSERFKNCSAVMLMLMRKDNNGKEEILLQKRQNTGYMDGYWDFSASGHVEDNEQMKKAMIRETFEELGVKIKYDDLDFVTLIHKNKGAIYYNGYFRSYKWENDLQIKEPEKCEKIKWFCIDKLPENLIDDRKEAIKNYENNIYYSEFGWDDENKN